MIVIGASVGGVNAIQSLLKNLPSTFPQALAVTMHRHRDSDEALIAILQRASALQVTEPHDKQPIEAGTVYIAPADYHMLVDDDHISLSTDEPVRYARPSVDVLFESAAATCAQPLIGIVLTGGGADGAQGAAAIEASGGVILIQLPQEAASADMPNAALAATQRAEVHNIAGLAQRLVELMSM